MRLRRSYCITSTTDRKRPCASHSCNLRQKLTKLLGTLSHTLSRILRKSLLRVSCLGSGRSPMHRSSQKTFSAPWKRWDRSHFRWILAFHSWCNHLWTVPSSSQDSSSWLIKRRICFLVACSTVISLNARLTPPAWFTEETLAIVLSLIISKWWTALPTWVTTARTCREHLMRTRTGRLIY